LQIFTDNLTNLTVKEDSAVGTIVGKIEAKDQDSGQYGKVSTLNMIMLHTHHRIKANIGTGH
jgi:DUF2075 family protein